MQVDSPMSKAFKTNTAAAAEDANIVRRLEKPDGPVDVVLDTDTYNEIDDQFALAYLIKNNAKLRLKAIYAVPFYNSKAESPADGMEKSFQEIHRVLALMDRTDLEGLACRGSDRFLSGETQAVESEAALNLVRLAALYTQSKPLYVIAIGALTNIASALLLDPSLREKLVVVWLGGNAHGWHHNIEFNIQQDVAAARVVFNSRVPLVQLPCMGVVSAFTVSGPELEQWLRGKNQLCDYLVDATLEQAALENRYTTWSRAIWDVAAVAWLLDGDYMSDCIVATPIPEYDHYYAFSKARHPMRYVYHINRDALVEDLFRRLAE